MYIKRIEDIEKILEEQVESDVNNALFDEEKVWEIAGKRVDEQLRQASIRMFPSAKGFTLLLCGTEFECKYDQEIRAFANDGYGIDTLLEVKDSLNKWQEIIDKAIDEERT